MKRIKVKSINQAVIDAAKSLIPEHRGWELVGEVSRIAWDYPGHNDIDIILSAIKIAQIKIAKKKESVPLRLVATHRRETQKKKEVKRKRDIKCIYLETKFA